MTPYADMTLEERMDAIKILADFCGYDSIAVEGKVRVWKRDTSDPYQSTNWNPFTDANALEDVEVAIRGYHWIGRYALDWSQDEGYRLVVGTAKGTMIAKTGNCNTKADALAQVVAVLVERKG